MVDIPDEAFAVRRSVCAVLQVDYVTHLEGISSPYWKTRPCKKAGKMVGTDYNNWAFRGLTFVPPDCTDWLLEREYDGPLSVFDVSKGFFPMLTG